jgi:methylase of polypeptide subunit release factors
MSRSMNAQSRLSPEQDRLFLFGRLLRDSGYWEACRLHRNRYIDRRYLVYLQQNKHAFGRETQALIELFVCRSRIPMSRLGFVPSDIFDDLMAEGVLRLAPDGTVSASYSINVLEDNFLLTEDFLDPNQSVYFGEDSEFYANMLEIAPGSRCLDLCTGTAVQALVSLSRGAAGVDAVDINPRAVHVSHLNGRLNGAGDRLTVYQGDMFEALPSGRTYDRITCNPPLLPIPREVSYPRIGDGGLDGLDFIRGILAHLPERLAAEGKCLLLGLSPTNGVSEVEKLCTQWCRRPFTYALYLLARQSIDDYAKGVVTTVRNLYPQQNVLKLGRSLRATYRALGADAVVSYYLAIRRTHADVRSGVYDLTRSNYSQNYWFVGGRQ